VTIRVLVADDQSLVRSGFRVIIDERPDLELIAEAEDGEQAIALAPELDPDVILIDIRMPTLDGVEATRRLVEAGTRARILVLTTFDLDEYVYARRRDCHSREDFSDVKTVKWASVAPMSIGAGF
jgi:DNA-binding NarL/FixJ family response regulator